MPAFVFISSRSGGMLGIAAVGVWVALYLVAAVAYPGYDVTRNFLSDLGHPAAPAAWAFNGACILAGLLLIPFGLSLGQALGGRAGMAGGALLAASAVALILVGVFPEESPNNVHFIVSLSFFLLLTASAGVLVVPLLRSSQFGSPAGIMAALTFAVALLFVSTGGRQLLEHATVYVALAWAAVTSWRLRQRKQ